MSCTLSQAAAAIRRGEVIAYPTEAVFGLGCDPANDAALRQLLSIKGRDADKGMILIASDTAQLRPWIAALDEVTGERCEQTWPGPVTWVLPAATGVSSLLTGGRTTLAVRVTAHALASRLCRQCGHALVSTSANLSGAAPARSAAQVEALFGERISCVLDGEVDCHARPSRIYDGATGALLRE